MKDLGDGMKTTMNVTRVTGNHLFLHDGEVEGSSTTKGHVSGGQPHPSGVGTFQNLKPPEPEGSTKGMDCDIGKPSNGEGRTKSLGDNDYQSHAYDSMET